MSDRKYEILVENEKEAVWDVYQNEDGTWEYDVMPSPSQVGDMDTVKELFTKGVAFLTASKATKIVVTTDVKQK